MFAYLVLQHGHVVPRTTLADVIWTGEPPRAWEMGLSAIMSNLHPLLGSTNQSQRPAICFLGQRHGHPSRFRGGVGGEVRSA